MWISPPNLIVRSTGGSKLGRCYEASYYEVETNKPLESFDILLQLEKAGFLGYGQTFEYTSKPEERVVMIDPTPCDDRGNHIPGGSIINKWSGMPYEPREVKRYIYKVTRTVDSSD